MALAEWVFADIPAIAGYFQRSSPDLAEMNALLAQLNEPGATVEGIADRFVAERQCIWQSWVGRPFSRSSHCRRSSAPWSSSIN